MSEYDGKSRTKGEIALNSQDITTNTTTVGEIIDTKGFESITFHILAGTITAGAFAFLLEEGDDPALSDATVLPVDNTIGFLTGFVTADNNKTKRVGSIGKKQFQRLSIVSTGVTGPNILVSLAIMGHPKTAPTDE